MGWQETSHRAIEQTRAGLEELDTAFRSLGIDTSRVTERYRHESEDARGFAALLNSMIHRGARPGFIQLIIEVVG